MSARIASPSAGPALIAVVAVLALAGAPALAEAQTLLDTTATLGKKPDAVVLPFTLDAAGDYRIAVTDFGSANGTPPPLARVDVAVTRGSALVMSSAGTGEKQFSAAAGDYRLTIVGQPDAQGRVGSMGVRIEAAAGGAPVLDTVQSFEIPDPPAASPAIFHHRVQIPAAGSYELRMSDLALPAPLASLNTIVVDSSGESLGSLDGTGSLAFNAAPGTYDMFVHAELASAAPRGLAGVAVRDADSGATVFATVDELGEWRYKYAFDLASAGSLSGTFTDFAFPAPLAEFAAVVADDGGLLARQTGSGSLGAAAPAGSYVVYVDAVAAAPPGAGSFGLLVDDSSTAGTLVEQAQDVLSDAPPPTDAETIERGFDIPAAGDYTLTLTDFGASGFFDAFTSLTLALSRDAELVGKLDAPGSLTFTATPGHYSIAILADPAGDHGDGLLGLRVDDAAGGAAAFEDTAAVGADFVSERVDVSATQSVDVTLTDLEFPAKFDSLRLAVTRGATRAGEIVGAGTFSFDATPGTYLVNVLAAPNAAVGYSTIGIEARVTPPAPAVTLAASPSSVQPGASGTLTWASTDASSCVASGGWTGDRPTSGTEQTAALNVTGTFTLTCTGAGGSASASATIDVVPASRHGGGGGAGFLWLGALAALGGARLLRTGRPAGEATGSKVFKEPSSSGRRHSMSSA